MSRATTLRQFADYVLDGRLDERVRDLRAAGHSWEIVARHLWVETDQLVSVTAQALRGWYRGEVD